MAKAKYNDPAYRAAKAAWRPVVAAGDAYCAEPVCVMADRWIPAEWADTQLWHLSHDPSGTEIIGPSHRRCNTREGAVRGNKMRSTAPRKLNRWTL